jgi:CheY-like chemotaxis protein
MEVWYQDSTFGLPPIGSLRCYTGKARLIEVFMERFETHRWSSHEVARLISVFESERRFYDEIVSLLPVPLATVGADGTLLSANQAFLAEFDIKREELERKSLSAIFGDATWLSALLPRETGILAVRGFAVHFTPISRWDRGETEWMVVFTPQTVNVETAPPAPVASPAPDHELIANTAAIEAAQRLAGRVTHEANNLLMIASGYGREILNQLPADSPLREDVSMLLGATDRIEEMAAQLNEFSRNARSEAVSLSIRDILPVSGYRVQPVNGEHAVFTDRAALAAVFTALTTITEDQLVLDVAPSAQDIVLTVRGFGLSAESLRQQFEVLNKAAREGKPGARERALMGPKLAQAGIRWRVIDPGALEMHVPVANTTPAPSSRSALVVDDQTGIRAIVRRILEGRGFLVTDAGSGEEAISLLDRRREPFDLLVTDMRMPGMTGRDLADRVRFRHPSTRILFISGFTDDPSVQSGILPDRARFLSKPFNPDQFVEAVNQLLA